MLAATRLVSISTTDGYYHATDIAVEMQRMGYKATPPCFPYIEAIHHGLIAVPEGMLWSGKKNQPADLIQRVLAPAGAQPGPAPAHPQGSAHSDRKPAVQPASATIHQQRDPPPGQPASATNHQQRNPPPGPSAAQGGVSNEQLLRLFDYRLDAVEGRLSTLQNGLQEIMNELRRGHSSLSLAPVDERLAAPAPINGMIAPRGAFLRLTRFDRRSRGSGPNG